MQPSSSQSIPKVFFIEIDFLLCFFEFLELEFENLKSDGVEAAHVVITGGAMNFLVDDETGQFFSAHVYR